MKRRILILFISILFYSFISKAQVILDSGDILDEISSFISSIPGSTGNQYTDPSSSELNTWNNAFTELINNNYNSSATHANLIGYDLIEYTDTTTTPNNRYYMLRPNGVNYWGLYVFNPNSCRDLVIQSPHPKKDFNTGKQGAFIFKETQSILLFIAGTNRCNHSSFSSCDGSTSVCSGSSENYRISDLAHNSTSIFQEATSIALNTFNDSYFIQLHGFSKLSTDPYVILSNGTQNTPSMDYLLTFQNKLYNEDNTLTFKTAHIDLDWTRLRGFTNTQGRLINGSSNSCDISATTTNGRFFHIEQEKTKLRNDVIGWTKVSNALINTFGCLLSLANESEIESLQIYIDPVSDYLYISTESVLLENVKIYNLLGQNMNGIIQIDRLNEKTIVINISELPKGIYFVKSQNTIAYKLYKQ